MTTTIRIIESLVAIATIGCIWDAVVSFTR